MYYIYIIKKFIVENFRENKIFRLCLIILLALLINYGMLYIYKPSIERIKDSVVLINVYDSDNELVATGSGFSAYEKDLIVTNFHVVEGAYKIEVISDDNKVIDVEELAFDKKNDLALLKINGSLKPLNLTNGKNLKVKDKVTAIGSPMGEKNTVSEGIISNLDDNRYIRITAPISHGSSGGVLLNDKNRVIGITNAGYDNAQNLNYSINVSVLNKLYKNLKDYNYELIGWDTYYKCIPNIANYNTTNLLSINEKCFDSDNTIYVALSLDYFYKATNKYEIFESAMSKIGIINGVYKLYKNFNTNDMKKTADLYEYLISEYENCDTNSELNNCGLSNNISTWSKEQFIMELDLLRTYELAIISVYLEKNSLHGNEITNFLSELEGIEYEKKIILNKLLVPSNKVHNHEIVDYFNNSNITFEQEVDVLRYLGFEVDAEGNIYW